MGDQISSGLPSIHDILKYKGMKEAQKFLVNHIDEINDKSLEKRHLETIVRGITNTTRIMDPGSSNYVPGDIAPLTTIDWMNKNNEREVDVPDAIKSHLSTSVGRFASGTEITPSVADEIGKRGVKRVKITNKPIVHEPFLMPLGIGGKAQSSEDWIARLAHNRIRSVLMEGTTQGWKTDIGDLAHPVSEYVVGDNIKK
jgi:DNA-directed RNA polymerase subunit beta'